MNFLFEVLCFVLEVAAFFAVIVIADKFVRFVKNIGLVNKQYSGGRAVLALLLVGVMFMTACSSGWIKVALQDLPVLTDMAINIAGLASELKTGNQLDASDTAALQNISTEANTDLNLLSTLYTQYESSPSPDVIAKINATVSDLETNLPALLAASHVKDAALAARVTAAVNLIVATVGTFAALIPQSTTSPSTARSVKSVKVPNANDLRKAWNAQVIAPTGKSSIDSILSHHKLTKPHSSFGDVLGDWFQSGR